MSVSTGSLGTETAKWDAGMQTHSSQHTHTQRYWPLLLLSYSSEDQRWREAQSEEKVAEKQDYGIRTEGNVLVRLIVYTEGKGLQLLCGNVFTACMPVLSCTVAVRVCVWITAGLLGREEVRDSPGLCRPSWERIGDESILDEPEITRDDAQTQNATPENHK